MKQTVKALVSIVLLLAIAFSAAGCEKKETSSNSSSEAALGDDFFADKETLTSNEENAAGTSESSLSGDSGKTSVGGTVSVPKENLVGGKSWEAVLSSMPKSLRGTTVTVYNWNPVSEYTGAPAVIEAFEKQTGIKVEWKTVNFDVYVTRLAALVASGESPDVVRTRTPVPSRLVSFQPLSAANYDFTDAAWDQTLMKDYTVNGSVYATSLKNTHLGSVNLMFYNKALINRYDIEDPYKLWKNGKWTRSKFLEICELYKKESKVNFACVGATWEAWTEMYGIAGPVGYDGSKYYSNLGNSQFLTVTQQIADLYNTSKLMGEGRAEVFDAGQSLFYAGASVYARKKNSYFGSLKSTGSFYAVPFPSVDGQSKYYQGRDEYEAYALAKGAKNPQAVPYFLRYFLDGGNYDLSGFFCNAQNLEVYNWCMNQTNTIWSTYFNSAEDTFGSDANGIVTLPGSQVKSFIDSNSSVIDRRVSRFNEMLANIKK